MKKKLGFRTLMDIIPLDASLVKGSHGRFAEDGMDHPIFITNNKTVPLEDKIGATAVFGLLHQHVSGS
jgi:hypothetical protein